MDVILICSVQKYLNFITLS